MSGIEIAGLILGAIPILVEAVDFYKVGIQHTRTAFRKRKYVEKLTHALLLQKQMLEETVKSILIASGCEDVWHLSDEPHIYLGNKHVQEQILDFIGSSNSIALNAAIGQSNDIIKKIAGGVAGFVPTFQHSTDDLLEIISANEKASSGQVDLFRRVKLLFSSSELKSFLEELEKATNNLNSFTNVLISNRQSVRGTSSEKSIKLAKALWQIRSFASNLYIALGQGWKTGCHSRHDAKLFLEDRVDGAAEILKHIRQETFTPILSFQLVFAASISQEQILWHDITVQVYNDNPQELSSHTSSQLLSSSKVRIATPEMLKSDRPKVTLVGDICGTIEATQSGQRHIAFVLTEKQQVGMIPVENATCIVRNQPDTITLNAVFLAAIDSPRPGRILRWKSRMALALTLASNLLQLLETQWLTSPWSKNGIYFMVQQLTSNHGLHDKYVDVDRPFVSLTFDTATEKRPQRKVEAKEALLELGILLLEIWHEIALETEFSLVEAPTGYYERLMLAIKWLNDDPLPDLYDQAVRHCIVGIIANNPHVSDWEDIKFWEVVCREIIEPLSQICKQFH